MFVCDNLGSKRAKWLSQGPWASDNSCEHYFMMGIDEKEDQKDKTFMRSRNKWCCLGIRNFTVPCSTRI